MGVADIYDRNYFFRALSIYVFVFLLFRLMGKKQLGEMSSFDFVLLLIISESVSNALSGGDDSISAGFISAFTLLGLGYLLDALAFRSKKLEKILEGEPKIIINNGKIVEKILRKEQITLSEIMEILHKEGLEKIEHYKEYIPIAAADGWLTERFVWLMLNKSPASKPAYIEKYKIKTVSVKYPYLRALRQSREDYSILYDEKYQGMFDVIVETASYTRDEWVQMYFMDKFAGGLECCEITTSVRLRAEQLGVNPGQFFRICWSALTGLTGEAKASFDLIIQNINSALDGNAGIASYMYKGNDLILQLISPLFVAEFREEFYTELKSRLPNDSILTTALLEMKTFLQQIHNTKDAHLLVAKLYEEFAYQEDEENEKTIAL